MKKLLTIIIASLLLVSCAQGIKFVPATLTGSMLNFTEYSKKDFLFTPYKYLGDYESIGHMTVISTPKAIYTDRKAI